MSEKLSTTLPATVEKIIKPVSPREPEKAQIAVEGADHLYREIRIENALTDENGGKVRLKAPRWKLPLKQNRQQRFPRPLDASILRC